jgi:uncharacterized protein
LLFTAEETPEPNILTQAKAPWGWILEAWRYHMTKKALRPFQVFAKPIGPRCNLNCVYCYYVEKQGYFPGSGAFRMPLEILENYIRQHIEASPDSLIRFSWHGGEPTLLGLDYFREIVALQHKHHPPNKGIVNGIQTNGTLLDDSWCRFLAEEHFYIGLSLDGPAIVHDPTRITKQREPTHADAMRGYRLLRKHGVVPDILCVVNTLNVECPLEIYGFFKEIGARYIGFLPFVATEPGADNGVSALSVPPEAFGTFLCTVFDQWQAQDIGKIKVQVFEEAAKTALGEEHELCIFRKTCGDVPVVEHNGDFFSCDHFVDQEHHLGNIRNTPLAALLESPAQRAFGQDKWDALPRYCRACEVLEMCHGGCPKNRIARTPEGEDGLNVLCAGYRRFFNHCRPFVSALAAAAGRRRIIEGVGAQARAGNPAPHPKTGRNDPCPCGSGRKYKKCCLVKE